MLSPNQFITAPYYDYYARFVNTGKIVKDYIEKLNQKTEDTFISIFGAYQDKLLEIFKSYPQVKIIWESPKAMNMRAGYNLQPPHNTIIVWEWVPEENKQADESVPKV